jgi:prepilin peptidase CpaA
MNIAHLAIGTLAIVGSIFDLRTRRIPNYLTFGSTLLAFIYFLGVRGWSGFGVSVAGWVLALALFIPFFLLRGMGGGDVKMIAALGAWFGPLEVLPLAFYTAMAGGVMAVVVALLRGYLSTAFRNLWLLLCHWRAVGPRPLAEVSLENRRAPRLCYGVAIAVGALTTLWLH